MRHLFVSYCHEDAAFAEIADAKISEAGFLTRRARSLDAAGHWSADIDAGIQEAVAVVVIMSPSALVSSSVNYEWAFAMGSGTPVVPILQQLKPANLPPRLSDLQWLDFSNDASRPWQSLMAALRGVADKQHEPTIRVPRTAPPAVRDVARAFDSTDAAERRSALDSLKQMNHPAAIELLTEAVRHPIPEVRFAAAFELAGKQHDARAVPALVEALRCGEKNVWRWFYRIGPPALPALLEALNDKEFRRQHCRSTLLTLGDIGGPAAVQALLSYIRDPYPGIRGVAACALGKTASSAALPALRETMHDPEPEVRDGTANGLGHCGAAAIADLLEMLDDSNDRVRHQVVQSLGEICSVRPISASMEPLIPRLIDALLTVLDDEYDQVRYSAAGALERLCDPRSTPGLIAALGRPGAPVHYISEAPKALGESALPALRDALNDPNEVVRCAAVKLVADRGDPADALRLVEVMRDKNPDVRLVTIRAITHKQYRSQVILQAVLERLHDTEEDVCRQAICTLRDIGNPTTVPHLIECRLKHWPDQRPTSCDSSEHPKQELL